MPTGDSPVDSRISSQFEAAVRLHQAGRVNEAEEQYRRILSLVPGHSGSLHLCGVACHQQGRHQEALGLIEQAIAIEPAKAVSHNNRGAVLLALDRYTESRTAFETALTLRPDYLDACSNLGLAFQRLSMPEAALEQYRRALRLNPRHAETLRRSGELMASLGNGEAAVNYFQQAVDAEPHRAELFNCLGNALLANEQALEAVAAYRQAISLDPALADAHLNLGMAFAEQERIEEARAAYRRAAELRPDRPLWGLRELGLCPAVFQSAADLDTYRAELSRQLAEFTGRNFQAPTADLATSGFTPSFNLAHHGRNNRALKSAFAQLFAHLIPRDPPAPPSGDRARIGFVVTRRNEGVFLRCTAGIIDRLDRAQFQPVMLCSTDIRSKLELGLTNADVEWATFDADFSDAVERVASARCDVLYHWAIGTDPLNYFLPFVRLARVQCTSWATQVTSGIPNVDYYLSSEFVELPEADEHYTERLIRMKTLPTWQNRIPRPAPSRSHFGLPADRNLYVCPQSLLKFHPDIDALFGGVLRSDPRGLLIVKEGRYSYSADLLRARFAQTLPDVVDRIVFVPWQKLTDYYRLISTADVVLDTLHFSAGSSTYDVLSFNQPMVTLPGEFFLGRYTLGCYRKLGFLELVAKSPDEYVQKAVHLGRDEEYRRHIQGELAQRTDLLFEDLKAVAEFEAFFTTSLATIRTLK